MSDAKTCKIKKATGRIKIPVGLLEFDVNSHTIWVQSADGATTLRIKCSGKINVEQCRDSPFSHCDIYLQGDINFCISNDIQP